WALAVALVATAPAQRSLYAQGSVSSQSVRPFVTGWIVVRGRNGAVGGVHVDANGVVSRTAVARRALDDARGELLRGEPTPKLRMVSLRGLEEAFAPAFLKGEAIPEDVLFLAGLQRIEFVLAVPEKRDIIL